MGRRMPELNVNPVELLQFSEAYNELAIRAAVIPPQAVAAVQHMLDTHGPMGYSPLRSVSLSVALLDPLTR